MGDLWLGDEHLDERRSRFVVRVEGEVIDPYAVAVAPECDDRSSERIEFEFDKKDLWHELTQVGLDKELTRYGLSFDAKDISELVRFTLTELGERVGVAAGWREEMMRFYLDIQRRWYAVSRPLPERRFFGFRVRARSPQLTPRWYWLRVDAVRETDLSLVIEGTCVAAASR